MKVALKVSVVNRDSFSDALTHILSELEETLLQASLECNRTFSVSLKYPTYVADDLWALQGMSSAWALVAGDQGPRKNHGDAFSLPSSEILRGRCPLCCQGRRHGPVQRVRPERGARAHCRM